MEDDLKKNQNRRLPKKKIKNLFSIPLKSRGKPFLGLAQLSKIFSFKIISSDLFVLFVFIFVSQHDTSTSGSSY